MAKATKASKVSSSSSLPFSSSLPSSESLLEILIRRDGLSFSEASELISQASEDLEQRLSSSLPIDDFCLDWFGLEDNYLMELI